MGISLVMLDLIMSNHLRVSSEDEIKVSKMQHLHCSMREQCSTSIKKIKAEVTDLFILHLIPQ